MGPEAYAAICVGGLAAIVLLFCAWMVMLEWVPMCVKRAWSRYLMRGCIQRKNNTQGHAKFGYARITPRLMLGAVPARPDQLATLTRDEGVGALVTMNELWELPFHLAVAGILGKDTIKSGVLSTGDNVSVASLQLPTPDFCAPTLADLERGVAWMRAQADVGQTVYVHCNAGKGRSAVLCIAFLMATKGWGLDAAHDFVQERRAIAKMQVCCGCRPQWRVLRAFERRQERMRRPHGNKVAPLPPAMAAAAGDVEEGKVHSP